jgi:hypothetical protein
VSEAILKGDLLTWPRACRPLALVAALGVAISCLLLSGCALFGIPEEGGHEPELFRNAAFSGPEPLGWSLINFLVPHFQLRGVREHVGVGLPSNFSECANADRADRVQHQESVGIARIPRTIFHVVVQSVSD